MALYRAGQLKFFGDLTELADASAFAEWLTPFRETDWVVYAKPPFGGPEAVLAYLSRYTHRVAISNHRLVSADANTVAFKWKDYRIKRGDRMKIMRLPTFEFIRRFLMHVLPDRFHRIRHYGFLAGSRRKAKVAQIRALLGATRSDEPDRPADDPPAPLTLREPCPDCGGQMRTLRSDRQYAGQRQALAQCHQYAVTGAGPPQKDRKTGPVLRSRPQRYAFKPGKIRETPTEIRDWGLHFPHSTAPKSRGFHLVRFVNAGQTAQHNPNVLACIKKS